MIDAGFKRFESEAVALKTRQTKRRAFDALSNQGAKTLVRAQR